MHKHRRTWGILVLLVTAVLLVIVLGAWILGRIVPKAMLAPALNNALSQLEERYRDNPLLILADSYSKEGAYTADILLTDESQLLGDVTYHMTVQTNGSHNQIQASGIATVSDRSLDLSVYLDETFMAVSSDSLVNGDFYGITYDTFSEDLSKIPLLSLVISDDALSRLDSSVQEIQRFMRQDFTQPEVPELSQAPYQELLLGIIMMPCEVGRCDLALEGSNITCQKLDFYTDASQFGQLLTEITDGSFSEKADITASFYLCKRSLVKLSLTVEEGEKALQLSLDLGFNPAENTLTLLINQRSGGQTNAICLTSTLRQEEGCYAEEWHIKKNDVNRTFSYTWDLQNGDMLLKTDTSPEGVECNLSQTEGGFLLVTDEFSRLLESIWSTDKIPGFADNLSACTMEVCKDSQILTPQYKNLSQWSLEDFIELLSGIGSVIGFSIG